MGIQQVIMSNLLGGKAGYRLGVADMARKDLQDQHDCRKSLLTIDNAKRCASADLERVQQFVDEGSDEVVGAGVVGSNGQNVIEERLAMPLLPSGRGAGNRESRTARRIEEG